MTKERYLFPGKEALKDSTKVSDEYLTGLHKALDRRGSIHGVLNFVTIPLYGVHIFSLPLVGIAATLVNLATWVDTYVKDEQVRAEIYRRNTGIDVQVDHFTVVREMTKFVFGRPSDTYHQFAGSQLSKELLSVEKRKK